MIVEVQGRFGVNTASAAENVPPAQSSFDYELILASDYESDEYGQVLVSLDGGPAIVVDELIGDGNGGADQTTGLQSLVLNLGSLDAGTHSLAIGGVNNKKTWSNETTEITIDDVVVTGTGAAATAASTPETRAENRPIS